MLYKRILLKLSGEALLGEDGSIGESSLGVNPLVVRNIAAQIASIVDMGIEVGIVVGGGNYCRGATLAEAGISRVSGDQIGMLATVMNALALQDVLAGLNVDSKVLSALPISGVGEAYSARAAKNYLADGKVVFMSAGTGNPFFTTDTAAVLRGIEIDADVVLKATKVDGVYSADPVKDPTATRFDKLSFDEVIERKLAVMDMTAMVLSRDNKMPIRVFAMDDVKQAMENETIGTTVGGDEK